MKIYLILFCLLITVAASAQNATPPRGSSYQDSVRTTNTRGKTTLVNGSLMNSSMDFVENLAPSKTYTLLLDAIRSASLVGTLKSRGPLTLFAPSDSAFRKKLGAMLDTLNKPAHKYELINLLSYHIISGEYSAKELTKMIKAGKGEANLLTLSGSKIVAKIDSNRNIVLYDETGGQSIINRFDIPQSNGIMHLITQVLEPKEKAM